MRRRGIAAMAVGTLATAAVAAGAMTATGGPGDAAGDLADAINARAGTSLTAEDVTGAYRDLLRARLDEAVAGGTLTRERADEILERAGSGPGLPGPGGPGHGRGPDGPRAGVREAVAGTLGLTEEQLRSRLGDGDSLMEIATAEGVARADLLAAIRASLEEDGVPAGRAGEIAEHIADRAGPGGPRRGARP